MLWSGEKNKNRHIKQNKKAIFKIAFFKILTIGGPGGVRTPDPTLRRRVLYPTELLTHLLNDNKYNTTKNSKCQQL